MVGKITATNTNEENVVKGQLCNYEVFYDADQETAYHLLSVGEYTEKTISFIIRETLIAKSE